MKISVVGRRSAGKTEFIRSLSLKIAEFIGIKIDPYLDHYEFDDFSISEGEGDMVIFVTDFNYMFKDPAESELLKKYPEAIIVATKCDWSDPVPYHHWSSFGVYKRLLPNHPKAKQFVGITASDNHQFVRDIYYKTLKHRKLELPAYQVKEPTDFWAYYINSREIEIPEGVFSEQRFNDEYLNLDIKKICYILTHHKVDLRKHINFILSWEITDFEIDTDDVRKIKTIKSWGHQKNWLLKEVLNGNQLFDIESPLKILKYFGYDIVQVYNHLIKYPTKNVDLYNPQLLAFDYPILSTFIHKVSARNEALHFLRDKKFSRYWAFYSCKTDYPITINYHFNQISVQRVSSSKEAKNLILSGEKPFEDDEIFITFESHEEFKGYVIIII